MALAFTDISVCLAQSHDRYPCEPSPLIANELAHLPELSDLSLSWEQRFAPLRKLADRYPKDIFVQNALQDALFHNRFLTEDWDAATKRYDIESSDLIPSYLRARWLARYKPSDARRLLERISVQTPEFPWPHLVYVSLAELPGALHPEEAEIHLRPFLHACPDTLEAYAHFRNVKDETLLRSGATHLRELLSSRGDEAALPYYRDLWDLELRLAVPERRDQVLQRVRSDFDKIKAAGPVLSQQWLLTVDKAYTLTKDPVIRKWLDESVPKDLPDSWISISIQIDIWKREHPKPSGADSLEAARRWRRQWPTSPLSLQQCWFLQNRSLMGDSEYLGLVDDILKLNRSYPDFTLAYGPTLLQIADEYHTRRVRLQQVPEILSTYLSQQERQERYLPEMENGSTYLSDRTSQILFRDRMRCYAILADYFQLQHNESKEKDVLLQWRAELSAVTAPEEATRRQLVYCNKRLVALGVAIDRENHIAGPSSYTEPLPEFELKDVGGRVWRPGDFEGKGTLLVVWASWCGPCQAELPQVQALYDRIHQRPDIQVVTVNVDEIPAVLDSWLKEHTYSFPIIPNRELGSQIAPLMYLPQDWIINSRLARSRQPVTIKPSKNWLDDITQQLVEAQRVGMDDRAKSSPSE